MNSVLGELDSDDGWDSTKAIERGYLKAGLKRYKIDHALLSKELDKETWEETFASASEKKPAKGSLFEGEPSVADVKLEHPNFTALQAEKKVLTSSEKTVRHLIASAKRDVATLNAMKNLDDRHWLSLGSRGTFHRITYSYRLLVRRQRMGYLSIMGGRRVPWGHSIPKWFHMCEWE